MKVKVGLVVKGLASKLVELRGSPPVEEIAYRLRQMVGDGEQPLSGSHIYSMEGGRYGASAHSLALLAKVYESDDIRSMIESAFSGCLVGATFSEYVEGEVEVKKEEGDLSFSQDIEYPGLANLLREKREATGLSAKKVENAIEEQLGRKAVSAAHLYNLEKDSCGISFEVLLALAKFYKAPELTDRVVSEFRTILDSEFSQQ